MDLLELPATDIDAFRRAFTGEVIRPDDADYDSARTVWNAMIERRPALVVRPRTSADVAAAIGLARDHALPLAVRGGGHNVAGLGGCDSGIVIDLCDLDEVRVDADARSITAGGGCTWAQVDAAGASSGLATTGGMISHTGVGGLALGGGLGWLMRCHGLSCDNLVSAEVVTATGAIVTADEATNPELFWALRGGGGNFGVVTRFTFRAHPVDMVLGGLMLFGHDRAAEVLAAYAEWAPTVPEEMTTMAVFLTAPPEPFVPETLQLQPAFAVALCHLGDHAEGNAVLDRLRSVVAPDADVVGPMPYPVLQGLLDDSAPHGRRSYWKSAYVADLDDALQSALLAGASRATSPFSQIHVQQLGGAVARSTTLPAGHRDAAYVVNVIGTVAEPSSDAANVAWVRDTWAAMTPYAQGAYVNYLSEDEGARVESAYDSSTWQRLRDAKRAWDPDNLFRINQNIPPAVG